MILLDTHALVWFASDDARLGRRADRLTDAALRKDELLVSAFSFWELAMLLTKRRLELEGPIGEFRSSALAQGIVEVPVDGEIGIAAALLKDFHGDPADRITVATALARGATVVTADERILRWRGVVKRHDARV